MKRAPKINKAELAKLTAYVERSVLLGLKPVLPRIVMSCYPVPHIGGFDAQLESNGHCVATFTTREEGYRAIRQVEDSMVAKHKAVRELGRLG